MTPEDRAFLDRFAERVRAGAITPQTFAAIISSQFINQGVAIPDDVLESYLQTGALDATGFEDIRSELRGQGLGGRLFDVGVGIGQDTGILGEAGVGGAERAQRLATTAGTIALAASTGGLGAGARLGAVAARTPGLSQATAAGSRIAAAIPRVTRPTLGRPTGRQTVQLLGAAGLAGTAALGALGGGEDEPVVGPDPIEPVEDTPITDVVTPEGEAAPEGAVAQLPRGSRVVPITIDGQQTGLYDVFQTDPITGQEILAFTSTEDELFGPGLGPLARAAQAPEQARRDRELAIEEGRFGIERANTATSILQALADPRTSALLRAGQARVEGQRTVRGLELPESLAALFGQQAGEELRIGTRAGEEVSNVDEFGRRMDTRSAVTLGTQDPTLRQVPTQSFLQNLPQAERDLLSGILTIGGISEEDFAQQASRLAPPGSGRGVSATVRRG